MHPPCDEECLEFQEEKEKTHDMDDILEPYLSDIENRQEKGGDMLIRKVELMIPNSSMEVTESSVGFHMFGVNIPTISFFSFSIKTCLKSTTTLSNSKCATNCAPNPMNQIKFFI
jgi:hypothetical protein